MVVDPDPGLITELAGIFEGAALLLATYMRCSRVIILRKSIKSLPE